VPLAKEFKGLGEVVSLLRDVTGRLGSSSALALLVFGIGADHHYPTVATDDAAFVAHPLD